MNSILLIEIGSLAIPDFWRLLPSSYRLSIQGVYQAIDSIQALFSYRAYDQFDIIEEFGVEPANDVLRSYTRVLVYFREDPRYRGEKRHIVIFQDHMAILDCQFDNKIVLEEYENNVLKSSQSCQHDSNDDLIARLLLAHDRFIRRSEKIALDRKSKKLGDGPFSKYWRTAHILRRFLLLRLNGTQQHRKVNRLSANPKFKAAMSELNSFFLKKNSAIATMNLSGLLRKQGQHRVFVNKRGYIETE